MGSLSLLPSSLSLLIGLFCLSSSLSVGWMSCSLTHRSHALIGSLVSLNCCGSRLSAAASGLLGHSMCASMSVLARASLLRTYIRCVGLSIVFSWLLVLPRKLVLGSVSGCRALRISAADPVVPLRRPCCPCWAQHCLLSRSKAAAMATKGGDGLISLLRSSILHLTVGRTADDRRWVGGQLRLPSHGRRPWWLRCKGASCRCPPLINNCSRSCRPRRPSPAHSVALWIGATLRCCRLIVVIWLLDVVTCVSFEPTLAFVTTLWSCRRLDPRLAHIHRSDRLFEPM